MKQNGSGKNEQATTSQSSENSRILEALLFASDEVLSVAKLKGILEGQPDARKIRKMVDEINSKLQLERHPFEITEVAGGFQFRTIAYYQPWVRRLFKERSAKKLSLQALECLAIIAYKQPITKAEIEAIRGVVSDGAMKTLLERRLVTISGRSDKAGRPLLYATSSEFLQYFGINKIGDLPKIEEFEALAKEKMEELSDEEAQMIDDLDEVTQDDENQQVEQDAQQQPSEEQQVEAEEQSQEETPKQSAESDDEQSAKEQETIEKSENTEEQRTENDESFAEEAQTQKESQNTTNEDLPQEELDAGESSEAEASASEQIEDDYGEDGEPIKSLGGFDADDEYEEYEQEAPNDDQLSALVDEDTSGETLPKQSPADEQPDALTDDDIPSDMLGFTDTEEHPEDDSNEEQSSST